MTEQAYTLPEELLREIAGQLDNEYTMQELDDTAMWASAGPVFSAASAGLASSAEHTLYYAASIYAGSMMVEYIKDGLLDPHKISKWVNDTYLKSLASMAADEDKKKSKKKK